MERNRVRVFILTSPSQAMIDTQNSPSTPENQIIMIGSLISAKRVLDLVCPKDPLLENNPEIVISLYEKDPFVFFDKYGFETSEIVRDILKGAILFTDMTNDTRFFVTYMNKLILNWKLFDSRRAELENLWVTRKLQ